MTTGPKKIENRGGARAGSGRKRAFSITEQEAKKMLLAAKRIAKERGKTLDEVLIGLGYDAEAENSQIAAIKVFKEFTMGRHSEQNVNITEHRGPVIGLPEMRPDPAKVPLALVKEGNE